MISRLRYQFVLVLLAFVTVALISGLTERPQAEGPTPPLLPYLGISEDPEAPRPQLLSPEDQQAALEQAMTNMWQWMPDYDRLVPEPRFVDAINGMIAYRQLSDDDLYLTHPSGSPNYGLVTGLPGVWNFEWSPDEKSLAFVAPIADSMCVYRLDLASRITSAIACGFVEAWEPRWSPDGQQLTFYGRKLDQEEGTSGVWVVPATTRGNQTRIAGQLSIAFTPSWLDNDTVLLAGRADTPAWAIYRVDTEEPSKPEAITPPLEPSGCEGTFAAYPEATPDESLVAFIGAHSSGSGKSSTCFAAVYTVDPAGAGAPALKGNIGDTSGTGTARYGRLRWNPDNQRVGVMGSGSDEALRLYVVNAANGNVKELVGIQGGSFSVWEWSPDGTRMAGGHAPDGGNWTLYQIDPNADTFERIREGRDPAWSSRPAAPPVDLVATGLEVTQAIQKDLNCTPPVLGSEKPTDCVPLVEGKTTWVRLYVKSVDKNIERVSARLIVTRDGVDTEYEPVNSHIRVTSEGSKRDDATTTFNFLLPLDKTKDEISIRAEVGPQQEYFEQNYDNNQYPRPSDPAQAWTFQKTAKITIYSYRFRFIESDGSEHVISHADAEAKMPYILATFPLAEDGLVDLKKRRRA